VFVAVACVTSGCRAAPSPKPRSGNGPFAPAATRTLKDFGAIGDGRADDTAALARALANSEAYCLDGQGRTYRVNGTLRAGQSLCLRNARLVQSAAPVDTAPYITRSCAAIRSAAPVVDCGDPAVPLREVTALWKSLSLRTLLIRPGGSRPIEVLLDRVKIDRGHYAEGGSRTDSAGIWLDGADRVDFRDVEITGAGKGYGLLITNASNVTLTNLWVHDLTWAPYRGNAPLSEARVAAAGWNSIPIHEFREQGRGGATAAKFYGVRIQEQLTCASLANVTHVRIENPRIERCMARFDTGDLPWQADGLDIGRSSSDVVVNNAKIDSTWEGMDVVAGGDGIDGLVINNLAASNSFSFGLKLGYELHNARVSGIKIAGAGLSGVVVYGPVRAVRISNATIRDVGVVREHSGSFSPWPRGNRAGIRIDEGSTANGAATATPEDVVIEDASVSGRPNDYEFGILNTGGRRIRVVRFNAEGFGSARTHGIEQPR
jgi:hypothetical protein